MKLSALSYNQKHPLILLHFSPVTKLIIKAAHESVGHAGRQHVLAYLREKLHVWILQATPLFAKFWLIAFSFAKETPQLKNN